MRAKTAISLLLAIRRAPKSKAHYNYNDFSIGRPQKSKKLHDHYVFVVIRRAQLSKMHNYSALCNPASSEEQNTL